MMRYKVDFSFEDIIFYSDEEEHVTRQSKKYVEGKEALEGFLKELRNDSSAVVIDIHHVSVVKSNLCLFAAKLISLLGGYKHASTTELFYELMRKSLVDIPYNKLCMEFDNKGFQYRTSHF